MRVQKLVSGNRLCWANDDNKSVYPLFSFSSWKFIGIWADQDFAAVVFDVVPA